MHKSVTKFHNLFTATWHNWALLRGSTRSRPRHKALGFERQTIHVNFMGGPWNPPLNQKKRIVVCYENTAQSLQQMKPSNRVIQFVKERWLLYKNLLYDSEVYNPICQYIRFSFLIDCVEIWQQGYCGQRYHRMYI